MSISYLRLAELCWCGILLQFIGQAVYRLA